MKEEHIKLLGQKFGLLTIKNIIPYYLEGKPSQKNYNAEVYCEACKEIKTLRLRSVLEGHADSCGCQKYKNRPRGLDNKKCIDLTNKRFGKLVALRIDPSKTKRVFWICQCDCGNIKSIAAKHLISDHTESCGCNYHRKGKDNPCWKGYEEISGQHWKRIQSGAKERDIAFNLDIEYAWKKFLDQNRKCMLSGIELTLPSGTNEGNASLDRIDSTKGYESDNIQWLDKNINLMKLDLPESKFIELCKSVAKQNEKITEVVLQKQ